MDQFKEILQKELPVRPWQQDVTLRLPGIQPLDIKDWILVDDVFDQQMAYRDWLIANRRDRVFQCVEDFEIGVAEELLAMTLAHLRGLEGFEITDQSVTRPDGVVVDLKSDHPLVICARLAQQDLLLMERRGDAQILTAGVLCFPASWSLHQKIGRTMMGIHKPIAYYDETLNKRITRLFDAIQPERLMWRANFLSYEDAELFSPRTEEDRRHKGGDFMRVERQALRKLPQTGAVLFSLHTYVVKMQEAWRAELAALED